MTMKNGMEDDTFRFEEERFERLLRRAFDLKRDQWIAQIAGILKAKIAESKAGKNTAQWEGVPSLGKLRKVVGGRFDNLKRLWLLAGLPLREHRGDRQAVANLNHDGWVELTNWLMARGYECRVAAPDTSFILELRRVK